MRPERVGLLFETARKAGFSSSFVKVSSTLIDCLMRAYVEATTKNSISVEV